MKSGSWIIQDDVLQINGEDAYIPTADQIYGYIFKDVEAINKIIPTNDPRTLLGGLEFSKYPLELIVELGLDEAKQNIYLDIRAERDEVIGQTP